MMSAFCAQRRPERQPRLHDRERAPLVAVQQRSTKAGASTPATLAGCVQAEASAANAQRRPERQPRLHSIRHPRCEVGEVRSTKAGASTPATRAWPDRKRHTARPLNEGRSVNPGYTLEHQTTEAPDTALNEGRSVNPGYTRTLPTTSISSYLAQRRPERQPRLHSPTTSGVPSTHGAQRRPERQPRLHTRLPGAAGRARATLNEGRSVNPGYTRTAWSGMSRPASAQRRPERQPRLHAPTAPGTTPVSTLNEGRSVNPGYTRHPVAHPSQCQRRSTKAGASTPATPVTVMCREEPPSSAQRRPERQPRLHC